MVDSCMRISIQTEYRPLVNVMQLGKYSSNATGGEWLKCKVEESLNATEGII